MAHFILDERVRLSIEMAMTAGIDDPARHRLQDEQARRFGMSGAEIDAARAARSFDAQISIALALATATTADQRRVQHERACRAGIDERVRYEIEAFAACLKAAL